MLALPQLVQRRPSECRRDASQRRIYLSPTSSLCAVRAFSKTKEQIADPFVTYRRFNLNRTLLPTPPTIILARRRRRRRQWTLTCNEAACTWSPYIPCNHCPPTSPRRTSVAYQNPGPQAILGMGKWLTYLGGGGVLVARNFKASRLSNVLDCLKACAHQGTKTWKCMARSFWSSLRLGTNGHQPPGCSHSSSIVTSPLRGLDVRCHPSNTTSDIYTLAVTIPSPSPLTLYLRPHLQDQSIVHPICECYADSTRKVLALHLESHITYTPTWVLTITYPTVCHRCRSHAHALWETPPIDLSTCKRPGRQSEVNASRKRFPQTMRLDRLSRGESWAAPTHLRWIMKR